MHTLRYVLCRAFGTVMLLTRFHVTQLKMSEPIFFVAETIAYGIIGIAIRKARDARDVILIKLLIFHVNWIRSFASAFVYNSHSTFNVQYNSAVPFFYFQRITLFIGYEFDISMLWFHRYINGKYLLELICLKWNQHSIFFQTGEIMSNYKRVLCDSNNIHFWHTKI